MKCIRIKSGLCIIISLNGMFFGQLFAVRAKQTARAATASEVKSPEEKAFDCQVAAGDLVKKLNALPEGYKDQTWERVLNSLRRHIPEKYVLVEKGSLVHQEARGWAGSETFFLSQFNDLERVSGESIRCIGDAVLGGTDGLYCADMNRAIQAAYIESDIAPRKLIDLRQIELLVLRMLVRGMPKQLDRIEQIRKAKDKETDRLQVHKELIICDLYDAVLRTQSSKSWLHRHPYALAAISGVSGAALMLGVLGVSSK